MEKFKVGQKVKCVCSRINSVTAGGEYEVTDVDGKFISIIDDRGVDFCFLIEGSFNAEFEPLAPKFTAVSGDQSLFDLVGGE